MYIIGDNLLSQFMKVAVKNTSIQDGQHLETLAFLLGYSYNENHIATDLFFPKQNGQAHKVDDEGIVMLHFKLFYCLLKVTSFVDAQAKNFFSCFFTCSKIVYFNRY